MSAKSGTQANQSIIDGISVLQSLAISESPVGGRELSRRLNLETTRVNRLLKTLASIGVAQQTPDKKYIPGPGMHVLAAQSLYGSKLLKSAIQPLERLAYFGHTIALAVLWKDSVSFLYHARPGMPSSEAIGRIGLRPATSSGNGMALLADLSNEEVISTYQGQDIPGFPGGVEDLLKELAVIREQGFSHTLVETKSPEVQGKVTHTVAITLDSTTCSAISLSGWVPVSSTKEIVEALIKVRLSIEQAMS
jgi:DNA-binding IclR family transcriptional regulator